MKELNTVSENIDVMIEELENREEMGCIIQIIVNLKKLF